MSHAQAHTSPHTPHQAALLPELVPPVQPDVQPRLAVWGLLAEDARHFTSAAGGHHLQVVIAQHLGAHPQACPVLATYHYPDQGTPNATGAAAHSAASRLRRGAEVVVSGAGQYPHFHNGRPVMALAQVQSIRAIADVLQAEPATGTVHAS